MTKSNNQDDPLVQMTTAITEAYVANNTLPPDQVSNLIRDVHNSLRKVASSETDGGPTDKQPAVPIKQSVGKDHVICLECGKKHKTLKRHLNTAHNLTPSAYRERWGLSADHPLVAPNYAARRSELAKQIGLGTQQKDEA